MKGWLQLPGDLYVKPIEMGTMFVIRPNVTQYEVAKMRKDVVEVIGTAPTPSAAAKLAMTQLTKAMAKAGRRSYRQAQRDAQLRRDQPSGLALADPMPQRERAVSDTFDGTRWIDMMRTTAPETMAPAPRRRRSTSPTVDAVISAVDGARAHRQRRAEGVRALADAAVDPWAVTMTPQNVTVTREQVEALSRIYETMPTRIMANPSLAHLDITSDVDPF